MSKNLFTKFFVLLVVVGLLFAATSTVQAQGPTVVSTETALTNALGDPAVTEIVLGANIDLTSTAYVTRDGVTIDGAGYTIDGPSAYHGIDVTGDNVTIRNLTITNSFEANLQFYRATGGVVTNVVLSNAGTAGMFVNGSQVTISNVTTTNNAWGGINVDQGSGVTEIPLLTVTNVTTHTSPIAGVTAAIWVDKGNPAWVAVGDLYTVVAPPNGYLVFYNNTEFATIASNFPIHNETLDIYYATIQEAINAANPGNTITVNGTHVLTSVVNVNKAITLTCAAGAKIQVSGTGDRFDVSAAATIRDCEIEKTDEVGPQDIIRLRASGITIQNNTIWGYWDKDDPYYVSRAMVVNAGGFSDILITENEIYGLRQPAYISGTHTGTISNNYVHDTKGWVLEGGNFTFTDNTWGTVALGNPNVFDIAIINTVGSTYYTNVPAMSAANNNAFIEDQRYSSAKLTPVYVAAGAPACTDCGTARMPYDTIQEGIDRVIPGGTVNILAGTYTEQVTVNDIDGISIIGAGEASTTIVSPNTLTALVGDRKPVFGINASDNVTVKNLTIDGAGKGNANYRFYGLFYYNSGGLIDHVTVKDIRNTPLDGAQSGVAIYGFVDNASVHTITTQYSTTYGYQKGGFTYNGVGLTAIVDHNTATGAGQTPKISMNGFQVGFGANATLTYNTTIGNYYTGDPAAGLATGILLYQPGTVTVSNNSVSTSNYGIALYDGGLVSITNNVVADNQYGLNLNNNATTVEYNQITGSTTQALWSDKAVDASPNWWGSATGPAAGSIEGPATYIPWCGEPTCKTMVYPPVHNVTQGTWFNTIQAAITAATAGDNITVAAGTYVEDLVINKSVNLQGAGREDTIIKGVATGVGGVIRVSASNVTIDGFTVEPPLGGKKAIQITAATNAFTFTDNKILMPANPTNENGYAGIESEYVASTNHVITGNVFVANGTSQMIYYNPTLNGMTFTGNSFTGTMMPNGAVLVFEAMSGTFDISGNTFADSLIGAYGFFGAPGLTPGQMTTIFGANDWPTGAAVVGTDIRIPDTKLLMDPATFATTDTCTGTHEVLVKVQAVTGMVSYQLYLGYDPALITVTNVENVSPIVGGAAFDNSFGSGAIKFGWYPPFGSGTPTTYTGDYSLIKITFQSNGLAGAGAFTIQPTSMLLSWPDAVEIPFEITGGASVSFGSVVTNTTAEPDKAYCDLAVAVAQAVDGDTLRVDANITLPATVTVDKPLTLDLNGKVVTYSTALRDRLVDASFALKVDGTAAALTVVDTPLPSTGKLLLLDSNTSDTLVAGMGIKVVGGTLNFNGGTIDSPYSSVYLMQDGNMTLAGGKLDSLYGIAVREAGASLTVTGGEIISEAFAISGNGTAPGTTITISGGTITSTTATAIYHPQDGTLNISGIAVISGPTGIEMKAGDLTVTGGTISGTGAYGDPTTTAGQSSETGDAILIYSHEGAGYNGDLNVNISGNAVITSTNAYALREYTTPSLPTRTKLISVTGGSFTGNTAKDAVTFTTVDPAVLILTDGQYNTDPGKFGADFVFTPYDSYISGSWFMIDPVDITAATLTGPFTAGLPSTVTVTIADTDHTGPFEVVFTYPAGTSITFGTVTYVCGATGCPVIPVTLSDPGPTTLSFAVILPGVGPYDVSVALNHVAGATDIRLLDSASATGVVASGGFSVSGTITMQGRPGILNGIPVTLYWDSTFASYGPSMTTDTQAVNFRLTVNYGGTYKFTTLQPRFLNITDTLGKTFNVAGATSLNALNLRAGNAVWKVVDVNGVWTGAYDNVINGADSSLVGTMYGTVGTPDAADNSGDVNFDNIVNIKDLTLVGGNMFLTNVTAYAGWAPITVNP